jgi:hypothetical protein
MSLGQWFRDYVYFPLGGSRVKSQARLVFNLFVVWSLTGIWHGASWNFVFWGLLYFVLLTFEKLTGIPGKFRSAWAKTGYRIFTLLCVLVGWVFFRAENIQQAFSFLDMMAGDWGGAPYTGEASWKECREEIRCLAFFFPILFCAEWLNRKYEYALERMPSNAFFRYLIYYALILSCFFFRGSQQTFIYFQF